MRYTVLIVMLMISASVTWADEKARYMETPYEYPKVVFDIYLDDPAKMSTALFWVRSLINPLTESPYDMSPDFMDIKVIIHGLEIVTLVKKNYGRYRDVVERMRYYAALGVEFKVCEIAAKDYDYTLDDFHEFVELVPSAITEIAHWQQQGYALIIPQVFLRTRSIEEIR